MFNIADNLKKLQLRIQKSAENCGRSGHEIMLLAVSKTQTPDSIRAAYELGVRNFGENYLQEALSKINCLDDLDICWHFIGPCQSNKSKIIATHFNWVHSLDRLKIAQRLDAQRPAGKPPLNCCIQVNISGEASKSGVNPQAVPELAVQIAGLQNLRLRGLMALPAPTRDQRQQRQVFAGLAGMLGELKKTIPQLDTLSMGMSADLDSAILEGATIIRVGTALFGDRETNPADSAQASDTGIQ